MQCDYIEISVRENKGIDKLLEKVVQRCLEQKQTLDAEMGVGGKTLKLRNSLHDLEPIEISLKKHKRKGRCCIE